MKNHIPTISYNPHTLQVLEFDRVREIITALADSEEGRAGISCITPWKDIDTVRALLTEVDEIMRALRFDDPLPGLSFHNIRELFPRLHVKGNTLAVEDIVAVTDNLELAFDISSYFEQKAVKYPVIAGIAGGILPQSDLVKHIRKVITSDFEIADDATPKLLSIRRDLKKTRNSLRKTVEKILAELPDEVIGERTVTIRDGRYVIPVRDSMKKNMPGAVHDRSQTGKTLFIEPLATIEGNNQIRELELAEQIEIMRILSDITERIASVLNDIEHNQDLLVRLDMIIAKARFGVSVEGTIPNIHNEPVLSIKNGRHPLLDWKYRKSAEGEKAVPLTMEIGRSYRTMVITGPNAGGKTVAIKTAGLLTMMALSGIPVPAGEDTSVFIPNGFYADIGDEQSIENDLSTFSSHMKQIVTILNQAGPGTLILMDELGGGTNPSDGEAIALAILKKLTGSGAITLATTHHDGLKVFAHETEGVINASMEFDNENLIPTFVLRTGIPGSSYAFEIAGRIGMPGDVLSIAESLAGDEKKSLEGLISEMEDHVRQADMERKSAESERLKMETAKEKFETELETITARKQELLSEALAESQEIVESTNRRIESIIKSLREKKASRESILAAKADLKETTSVLKEKATHISHKKVKKKWRPVVTIKHGMSVWVESIGTDAVVEEVLDDGEKARIRAGKSKATIIVNRKDLSLSELPKKKKTQTIHINVRSSKPSSQEIDLRGMTFDEARDALVIFFDTLHTSGFETAHIIHGKGTGALRNKIGKYLEKHEYVKSWRLGNWNEGSFGVTVVTLKR